MNISHDLVWWVTVFDLPAMAGLFWLIWRTRHETESAIDHLHDMINAFKLEVAKTYASQSDMRELEGRITSHLLRIEAKLDVTALKAEGLRARTID